MDELEKQRDAALAIAQEALPAGTAFNRRSPPQKLIWQPFPGKLSTSSRRKPSRTIENVRFT
jgi:hypothetical protein